MRPVAALRPVSPPRSGSLSRGGCYGLDPVEIVDPAPSCEAARRGNGLWILPDPWTTLEDASPTGPWTALTPRRPQAPQALLLVPPPEEEM
jgi:hypothetical protein